MSTPSSRAIPHDYRVGERVAYRRHRSMRVGTVRGTLAGSCLVEVYWDQVYYPDGRVREYGTPANIYYLSLERVALVKLEPCCCASGTQKRALGSAETKVEEIR